jgi:hypothetical protein
MRRADASRPELFFIYGIIVSAIVIVMFVTKVNELSQLDDIIVDYYANELSVVVEITSARSGYARLPFEIVRLENPRLNLTERTLGIGYGELSEAPREKRDVLPNLIESQVIASEAAFIARDHQVEVVPIATCDYQQRDNLTFGNPLEARLVTIIVSDPSAGCVEFERIVQQRSVSGFGSSVQRVIVERELPEEVVILAR